MRFAFTVAAIVLFSPVALNARIGETLAQCEKRYGSPLGSNHVRHIFPTEINRKDTSVFLKEDIYVSATFFEGKVERIAFTKFDSELSSEEVLALLKANGGSADWQRTGNAEDDSLQQWRTMGGTLTATLHHNVLEISTDAYRLKTEAKREAEAAAERAKSKRKMQGF